MLVLTPATLLGTTTGVFFNKMSPNWLIMLLLVALCAVTGKRTLAKARSTYDKETRAMQTVYSAVPTKEEEALALKRDENDSPVNARAAPGTRDPLLEQIVAEESKFPWGTAFSLAPSTVSTFLSHASLIVAPSGRGPAYQNVFIFANVYVLSQNN